MPQGVSRGQCGLRSPILVACHSSVLALRPSIPLSPVMLPRTALSFQPHMTLDRRLSHFNSTLALDQLPSQTQSIQPSASIDPSLLPLTHLSLSLHPHKHVFVR